MGRNTRIFYWVIRVVTLVLFVLSILGLVGLLSDSQLDYGFIGFNAIALFVLSLAPNFLIKKGVNVPNVISNVYLIFIAAALLLGEIAGFYIIVPHWDSMLHFSTGSLIGLVGFSLIDILNNKKAHMNLTPLFIALFVFAFSMTMGTLWEILEYGVDIVAGSNMQRFKDSVTLVPFVGAEALKDTMKDLILNTLGSLLISILGFIDLKRNSFLLNKLSIKKLDNKVYSTKKLNVVKTKNKSQKTAKEIINETEIENSNSTEESNKENKFNNKTTNKNKNKSTANNSKKVKKLNQKNEIVKQDQTKE